MDALDWRNSEQTYFKEIRCDHESWIVVGQDMDHCGDFVCADNHLGVLQRRQFKKMESRPVSKHSTVCQQNLYLW
jgi:hypothetical protein